MHVDQLKARRAGISSEEIAQALQMRYSGVNASLIRDDGVAAPIVLRGNAMERTAQGIQATRWCTLKHRARRCRYQQSQK